MPIIPTSCPETPNGLNIFIIFYLKQIHFFFRSVFFSLWSRIIILLTRVHLHFPPIETVIQGHCRHCHHCGIGISMHSAAIRILAFWTMTWYAGNALATTADKGVGEYSPGFARSIGIYKDRCI